MEKEQNLDRQLNFAERLQKIGLAVIDSITSYRTQVELSRHNLTKSIEAIGTEQVRNQKE